MVGFAERLMPLSKPGYRSAKTELRGVTPRTNFEIAGAILAPTLGGWFYFND
jgi:hypothetical protein